MGETPSAGSDLFGRRYGGFRKQEPIPERRAVVGRHESFSLPGVASIDPGEEIWALKIDRESDVGTNFLSVGREHAGFSVSRSREGSREPPFTRSPSVGRELASFAAPRKKESLGSPPKYSSAPRPSRLSIRSDGTDFGNFSNDTGHFGKLVRSLSDSSISTGTKNQRLTIHGQYFHAMISYRVASEGDGGSGLSNAIYDALVRVSLERDFRMPRSLWGEWPLFAKKPPFGMRRGAKVYLDSACLLEGEPWECGSSGDGGFAGALRCSLVFVPLMSFTHDGGGSLGQMMRLATADYCDNVLLELTVALGVWRSDRLPLRAIMPVLVGQKDSRGVYSVFPFAEVAKLPNIPSPMTNARAAEILQRFGLEEEAMKVHDSTIKDVVSAILAFQGVQLSNEGLHSKAVRAVAERTLKIARKHVLEGMEEFLQRQRQVKGYDTGTPCGYEVIEWLHEKGLGRYVGGFAAEKIDSLYVASRMTREDIKRVMERTKEASALHIEGGNCGDQDGDDDEEKHGKESQAAAGDVLELEVAVESLGSDGRARQIKERMLWYVERDEDGFNVAITKPDGMEVAVASERFMMHGGVTLPLTIILVNVINMAVWSHRFTVMPHASDFLYVVYNPLALHVPTIISYVVLKLSPPAAWESHARWWVATSLGYLIVWLAESLYFVGENAVPPTFLRQVRYPAAFLLWITLSYYMRFARASFMIWSWIAPGVFNIVYAIGCFLGEDPGHSGINSGMAWVYIVMALGNFLQVPGGILKKAKTQKSAIRLLVNERESFHRAWEFVIESDGGEKAVSALVMACNEVERQCEEEAREFEATVPMFGAHQMYFAMPPVRQGLFTPSGKPRQAVSDLDVLFQQARVVNPHFHDWVKSWAGWGNGVEYLSGPVKHAGRVIQKCIRAYGRDVAAISDLVRCTVIYHTMQGVHDFFMAVKERSDKGGIGMLRIRRIKNRYDKKYDARTLSMGYRDLSILVEVGWIERGETIEFVPVGEWNSGTSRHICEIQVHVRATYEIKVAETHTKYCKYRDLMAM